ncbi:MAG TPA: MCE family protein [Methylothermaceae bacterium]|nr:MCE family protein [Methylothermaceae bacterium]
MSKRANPTLIGAFVIGAIVLFFVAVLVFGGAELWAKRDRYVIFFAESVNGLNIGAPVKMRGVQIGKVTDIRVIYDPRAHSLLTQVIIEVKRGHVQMIGESPLPWERPDLEDLIQTGLRAQLKLQSLVTGQLYVDINFHPETPVELVGAMGNNLPEIPAIPSSQEEIESTISELVREIRQLPLKEMFTKLDSTLTHLDATVSQPEFQHSVRHLDVLLADMDRGINQLSRRLDQNLILSQRLLQRMDKSMPALLESSAKALQKAQKALDESERTLIAIRNNFGPDSALTTDFHYTLESVREAAQEIRVLAETLQTQPEILLQGKRR